MKEVRQRKTNTACYHLYVAFIIVRLTEAESRMVVARGWGRRKGEDAGQRSRVKVSVTQDEKVLGT